MVVGVGEVSLGVLSTTGSGRRKGEGRRGRGGDCSLASSRQRQGALAQARLHSPAAIALLSGPFGPIALEGPSQSFNFQRNLIP